MPHFQLLTIFFTASATIAGQWLALPMLVYVFKPLTTILILVLTVTGPAGQPAPYRRWIALGLLASLAGDVFLMLPANAFIQGLLSFLVAHLCYLRALCSPGMSSAGLPSGRDAPSPASVRVRLAARGWPFAMYALISSLLLAVLYPRLPTTLVLPVLAYVVCLAGMAAQSLARHLVLDHRLSALAAWGGLFFVSSDAMLAFNKFHTPFAWSSLGVLSTYWLAQTLLALSARRQV